MSTNGTTNGHAPVSLPRINTPAPDFTAKTTHGELKVSPTTKASGSCCSATLRDFTSVCTTEFLAFARKHDEFLKRNTQIIGLFIDSIYSTSRGCAISKITSVSRFRFLLLPI